jgi:class 3 adenylate cyclase
MSDLPVIKPSTWAVDEAGALDAAILFVDLVSSSEFASVMGLREYAEFVESFHDMCMQQCGYVFDTTWRDKYLHDGRHYAFEATGDELVVFLHTERPHDDVYQLICLAITLKCAWLGMPYNADRIRRGVPASELAVGIHSGRIWAVREPDRVRRCGFAINLAKRTESVSRQGSNFRIAVTDPAYKRVNTRLRNLLFGPRIRTEMKGIVLPIGVYEIVDSFVNPARRMAPQLMEGFETIARDALATSSFDLWIHSCLQVSSEAKQDRVSDSELAVCEQVLNIAPANAVALYYAAQGYQERGDDPRALLHLEDLTKVWARFADGWLERGKLLSKLGEKEAAHRCLQQARRLGAAEAEAMLAAANET